MKDYEYIITTNGGIIIVDYLGSDKAVAIPSEMNGRPVTHIGQSAFALGQLTSVTIPDRVVSIGARAFMDNRLTNVIIPNNVTSIDGEAFSLNLLTNVVIFGSDTTIALEAFANNPLSSVTIGDIEIPVNLDEEEWTNYYNEKRAGELIAGLHGWELLD